MGVYEKEGVCWPCCGYDTCFLKFPDEDDLRESIVSMCSAFGHMFPDVPRDSVYSAFHTLSWYTFDENDPLDRHSKEMWDATVAAYRAKTGRTYPPVYRVHIRIEAEPLTDKETAKYWKGK